MWRKTQYKEKWDICHWITILEWWYYPSSHKVKCKCYCGEIFYCQHTKIKNNRVKSCGCYKKERVYSIVANSRRTHWMSDSHIYNIWQCIKKRCKHKHYVNYYWKGISYDKCWESFQCFYKDMWEPYEEHFRNNWWDTSIDRIDVNWNYCKSNCRWATWKIQNRNRSNNTMLTYNGRTMCLAEWSEELWVSKIIL